MIRTERDTYEQDGQESEHDPYAEAKDEDKPLWGNTVYRIRREACPHPRPLHTGPLPPGLRPGKLQPLSPLSRM